VAARESAEVSADLFWADIFVESCYYIFFFSLVSEIKITCRPRRVHSIDAAYCYRWSNVVCVMVTTVHPAERLD